jgi:hypothetical protein
MTLPPAPASRSRRAASHQPLLAHLTPSALPHSLLSPNRQRPPPRARGARGLELGPACPRPCARAAWRVWPKLARRGRTALRGGKGARPVTCGADARRLGAACQRGGPVRPSCVAAWRGGPVRPGAQCPARPRPVCSVLARLAACAASPACPTRLARALRDSPSCPARPSRTSCALVA